MKLSKRFFSFVLMLVLLLSSTSITAFAKGDIMYGIGFTTGSSLRLRSEASTNSKILDVSPKDEVVVVVKKVGDWYKVIYNLQEGYMHSNYVSVLTRENAELGYGKINGTFVNLRSGPSTSYKAIAQGDKGDKVYIIGLNNGWYKVIYGSNICYIRSDFVDLTEIPYENKDSENSPKFFEGGKSTGVRPSASALNGTTNSGSNNNSSNNNSSNNSNSNTDTNTNTNTSTGSNSGNTGNSDTTTSTGTTTEGQLIADTAKKYLGIPYVWGGASPSGFDCSGLVYYVLRSLGYSTYRTPADQYKQGIYVAKADLQPGDIVYFHGTYKSGISHVGIYMGNGKFIHSPHTGAVVSYADLNSTYYTNHYYGARRMTK